MSASIARRVAEDRAELGDPLLQVGVLVLDLLAREPGEAREAEVEDRLGLDLGEPELLHQPRARRVGVVGAADQRDHRVEVVERDQVALEDVRALLGLAQLELRAARDDLALVVEVVADELEQRQRPRHAVDERDGVVAERRLQRRVLEELVERDLRDRVALELDLDPHARTCRSGPARSEISVITFSLTRSAIFLITPLSPPFLTPYGSSVTTIALLPPRSSSMWARARMTMRPRPVRYASRMPDAADDDRAGREVGALEVLHQVVDVRVGLVDQLRRRRRSSRRGCAAACSSPCRPRSRTSR